MKKTTVDRAIEYILQKIKAGFWKDGQRLPTLNQLAANSEVSRVTMHKAVKALAQKGIVSAKPGRGIIVGKFKSQKAMVARVAPRQRRAKSRAQNVGRRIAAAIVEGRFPANGILPTIKELCHEFGTGYQTMNTALGYLETGQWIELYKKRFRIRQTPLDRSREYVVLVLSKSFFDFLTTSYAGFRFASFSQHVTKECSVRRLKFVTMVFDDRFSREDIDVLDKAYGFILWTEFFDPDKLRQVAGSLLACKRHLVLFGDDLEFPALGYPQTYPQSHLIHLVGTSDVKAGYHVGQYLLARGHRKVFFAAPHYADDARLRGLRQAFRDANMSEDKVLCRFGADPNQVLRESRLSALRGEITADLAAIDDVQRHMSSLNDRTIVHDQIISQTKEWGHRLWLKDQSLNLFYEASLDKSITAWVCWDDYVAVFSAMFYCGFRNLKIPQDVSIVGFNNQIEAEMNRLTSYDFNISSAVGRMFEIFSRPTIVRGSRPRCNTVEEVSGFVAERRSVVPSSSTRDM
jgi:DNA-binding LacI/PurR family transcriptional regulator/DNA-binding transcriptional regulator YhcF (GntR family)